MTRHLPIHPSLACLLLLASPASAATVLWSLDGSGDFFEESNWQNDPGGGPIDLRIDEGLTIIDSNGQTGHTLNVNSGLEILVGGADLVLTGNTLNAGGDARILQDAVSGDALTGGGTGSLNIAGDAIYQINGTAQQDVVTALGINLSGNGQLLLNGGTESGNHWIFNSPISLQDNARLEANYLANSSVTLGGGALVLYGEDVLQGSSSINFTSGSGTLYLSDGGFRNTENAVVSYLQANGVTINGVPYVFDGLDISYDGSNYWEVRLVPEPSVSLLAALALPALLRRRR